jgi:hypothetical protein
MDVEDIPEDADFEWCWDEEGRMKIEEINKVFIDNMRPIMTLCAQETEDETDSKQGQPEEVKAGVKLQATEKM